jgi:hypothetical protein
MKNFGFVLLIILLTTIYLQSQQLNTPLWEKLITMAKEFVVALENGRYDDSVKHFDKTMTKLAPPEKMKEVWEAVIKQVGPFKEQKGVWTESLPKYDIVYVTCEFEKATLDIKVVFNKNKQISGQFFVPPRSTAEYTPPKYVDKKRFSEQDVKFGVERWLLPGTLSLPNGNGPFPALVLVHGSGPNDRDESLGPNKTFRDLAWGLASQGIAVLRYDKRTKVHGQKMVEEKNAKLTVYEETIQDALAAANHLRKTEMIDAKNIYILGHSLGGMLIPRIAGLDSKNTGFIIMAGPTRPMEDLFVEQIKYISLLDGKLSDEEKANLENIKSTAQKIKNLTPSNSRQMTERFLGAGADYWLDLKGYEPAESAKSICRPLLILQGGRDYQVTLEDFDGWKKALTDRDNVDFKLYPAHNHLLIPGKGKCTPAEYQKVGHLDKMVIDDIVNWIQKVKK